jgi:hypothetical protein
MKREQKLRQMCRLLTTTLPQYGSLFKLEIYSIFEEEKNNFSSTFSPESSDNLRTYFIVNSY